MTDKSSICIFYTQSRIHFQVPKSEKNFSEWVPGNIKPIHEGIYDVCWFGQHACSGSLECTKSILLEWTGKNWQPVAWVHNKPRPIIKKVKFWRGLNKL